jgi:succinate dehydrogenase/fumarate reductase iron-sulfur protein
MSQRAFGGHTYRRLVHIGDRTGLELIRPLQDKTVHSGVDVFMETTVTRLIKDADRVVGCFGYTLATGEQITFTCRALVVASGGSGRIYRITSNSQDCTGDGYVLAYEAGAELVDMEFVQFHPTGMVFPPGVAGLLVTEAVRGEGGLLRNRAGERFMERYDAKRMELSTRDVVARSIYTEVREGRGSPHGGVFLDVSHLDSAYVRRKLPSMYDQFLELAGVDITAEPMEVGPTCHYFMGGIRVDGETGETCVPGLFATGEATGGMNGANRLGGNSLSDLLVFGRRAGIGAATAASAVDGASPPSLPRAEIAIAEAEVEHHLHGVGTEDPFQLHRELQTVMGEGVGIFRDREGLALAISRLEELDGRAAGLHAPSARLDYNPGWRLCREVRNMITVSLAVARASPDAGGEPRRSQPPGPPLLRRVLVRAQHRDLARRRWEHDAGTAPGRNRGRAQPAGRRPQGGRASMSESMAGGGTRRLQIWRGEQTGGALVDFEVDLEPGMVVLDAVLEIQRSQAPDLAVRWNCKAAKCGSCSAEINGKPRLMCKTRIDHLPAGEPITVEPMRAFPLIRDLVTDVSWNYEVNKRIPPFTPRENLSDDDFLIAQQDTDRMSEFRKCIECFMCQDVCHVLRDHGLENQYYGPRFMIRLASLDMHPLDGIDRLDLIADEAGIGLCNITKCCTEVCPEGIHITDNAIIPLKERIVDRRHDPLLKLFKRAGRDGRRKPKRGSAGGSAGP